jgi:uncharacterized membrane protein
MNWLQRYRARHYVRNSLWIPPLLGMLGALVAVRMLHWIETRLGWESGMDPDTARALLGTLASAMFTFIVFVCSALLVAVQLASAQLTPRLIALVFNERGTRMLRQELVLIHRSAERSFIEPEDRALAGVSDLQGVGGTAESLRGKRK